MQSMSSKILAMHGSAQAMANACTLVQLPGSRITIAEVHGYIFVVPGRWLPMAKISVECREPRLNDVFISATRQDPMQECI